MCGVGVLSATNQSHTAQCRRCHAGCCWLLTSVAHTLLGCESKLNTTDTTASLQSLSPPLSFHNQYRRVVHCNQIVVSSAGRLSSS